MNQQTSTGPGTSSVVIEPELKYYRVRTEIETILSGLEEGDAVPSERELAGTVHCRSRDGPSSAS